MIVTVFRSRLMPGLQDEYVIAAVLGALGASPKFGGYAIFFAYTTLLGLPALVLAVVVRRSFEKETPPS